MRAGAGAAAGSVVGSVRSVIGSDRPCDTRAYLPLEGGGRRRSEAEASGGGDYLRSKYFASFISPHPGSPGRADPPPSGEGKKRHEDLSQVSVRCGHGWFFAT